MPNWIFNFPEYIRINITDPIDNAIHYMIVNWDPFFTFVTRVLSKMLSGIGWVIGHIPWWLWIVFVFIAIYRSSRKLKRAILYSVLLFFVGAMGLWPLMNQTLTIVVTSVIISLIIGLPVGIIASRSDRAFAIIRPILDTMQTMPAFVYLIPAVMLLGIGNVPAIIATIIYALPPVTRLTCLGIRQVDTEVVEAARAFGSTRFQTLFKVQLPQALPTIMAGVNQTIMMAIAMVVTCSMIGATGLGAEVIQSINRLESGRGFAAGIAIVIVAIIMDRLMQGIMKEDRKDS